MRKLTKSELAGKIFNFFLSVVLYDLNYFIIFYIALEA